MIQVFTNAWPATVSEMLQDTEAAHGMVFRSLVVTGGLIAMQTDFSTLSPAKDGTDVSAGVLFAIGVVHLFRRLVLAGAVGFLFAPATGNDHGVSHLREETSTSQKRQGINSGINSLRLAGTLLQNVKIKNLPSDKRALLGRTAIIVTVHVLLASTMLSTLPMLELAAILFDGYYDSRKFLPLLVEYDWCAIAWFSILVLRFFHVAAIFLCLSVSILPFFIDGDRFTTLYYSWERSANMWVPHHFTAVAESLLAV